MVRATYPAFPSGGLVVCHGGEVVLQIGWPQAMKPAWTIWWIKRLDWNNAQNKAFDLSKNVCGEQKRVKRKRNGIKEDDFIWREMVGGEWGKNKGRCLSHLALRMLPSVIQAIKLPVEWMGEGYLQSCLFPIVSTHLIRNTLANSFIGKYHPANSESRNFLTLSLPYGDTLPSKFRFAIALWFSKKM